MSLLLVAIGLVGCAGMGPDPDHVPRVRGPLATRPQHPMLLSMLGPRPRRTVTQAPGTTGLATAATWSSIFEQAGGPNPFPTFRMDGEFGRASLRLRHGLGSNTDVEIELAALYGSSGFLDPFVEDFHEFFGFPNSGRELAPTDDFQMSFTSGGTTHYRFAEDTIGFGDVPITLTHRVRAEDEDGPGVALRLGVELPTGDEDRGFGNGGVDVGAGVLLERTVGPWTWTGSLDVVVPSTPDGLDLVGFEYSNQVQAYVGIERSWSARWSWLLGLHLISPITDDFDAEEIDREILDLGIGFAWDVTPNSVLQASFHEDLVAATGADFGVYVGWLVGF